MSKNLSFGKHVRFRLLSLRTRVGGAPIQAVLFLLQTELREDHKYMDCRVAFAPRSDELGEWIAVMGWTKRDRDETVLRERTKKYGHPGGAAIS